MSWSADLQRVTAKQIIEWANETFSTLQMNSKDLDHQEHNDAKKSLIVVPTKRKSFCSRTPPPLLLVTQQDDMMNSLLGYVTRSLLLHKTIGGFVIVSWRRT